MDIKLHDAAHFALDALISAAVPAGGCDDADTLNLAIRLLRDALGDKRDFPYRAGSLGDRLGLANPTGIVHRRAA